MTAAAPDPHSAEGDEAWTVRVPASTSNLGPGFDLLGMALDLPLEVRMTPCADASPATVRISEATRALGWPEPERGDDLLIRAFERARAAFGAPRTPVRLEVDSRIPVARGLGSSGAAVAAGLLLGSVGAPRAVHKSELLALGIELEGHPDNVAPALLGGLCAALLPQASECSALGLEPGVRVVRLLPHPDLRFCVAWPDVPLATARARALLPEQVPFAAAAENPRRLALLLEGLRTGAPDLLALGGEDRLHLPHRLPLVPGGADALDRARRAGAWLATLSGSGTALFAMASEERIESVVDALRGGLEAAREPGQGPAVAQRVVPVERAPEPTPT